MALILCGAISAANTPLNTTHNGTVSGDLYVNATQPVPWANQPSSATVREFNQTFNLPNNSGLDWAQVYINIYSGSGSANWPANATIMMDGNGDGTYETTLGTELLSNNDYSPDGTIYWINDHCTRVYSDYQLWYNVTGLITSNNPSVYVKTEQVGSESFDGRLKLIAMVAAYNDGDSDKVNYWVNDGQDWINTGTSSTSFATGTINKSITNATLNTVALSSKDGTYNFNGTNFTGTNPVSPVNFFETHTWDVTGNITQGANSTLTYGMASGQSSFKNVLATLTLKEKLLIDLAITGNVDVVPTGKNTVFAKETNPVKFTVKNNGSDGAKNILVSLFASDVSSTMPVATTIIDSLAGGASTTLEIIDPTIRNLEGGTLIYTIKLDPNNTISETDETNNNVDSTTKAVKYNGYKGKQYWGNGSNITTQRNYDIYGDVVFSSGNSSYHSGGWDNYTINWSGSQPTIPTTASVKEAWLYVPYNWDETNLMPNNVTLTFNGSVINYVNWYFDQSNFGTYANYKYGLLTYNVTSLYNKNGVNTLFLDRNGTSSIAMYPLTLMVIYEDINSTRKQIFINEDADLVGFSQTSYGTTQDEATAYAPFTGLTIDPSKVKNGTLYSFAGSAGPNEGNLLWNGSIITSNAWQGSSTTASALVYNITSCLTGTGNIAGIQSTNSGGMAAFQQVLVVEYAPDLVVTDIVPNKGNGDCLFANEPNVLTVTIANQGASASPESTVKVNVKGTDYTVNVPALAIGASTTVTVIDTSSHTQGENIPVSGTSDPSNTIPETNETNNTLNISLTVYNNGYKGKRYTNGSDLETQQEFHGKYDVIYSSGNTAYNSAQWTVKTYNWTSTDISIPSGATVVSARLYQGYAYNKKVGNPGWTLTFNGSAVSSINSYMDTKGWGSYNYPYGLYVYDVTNLFNRIGNSMTISPESGNDYALYGAYLVVVYQDANTKYKDIWINDGFDMLCSKTSYSVNNNEATAYANYNSVNSEKVTQSQVIAILASANDANKSKFFFNGNEYAGFWTDYNASSQTGFSLYDVTGNVLNGINTVAMQSYDTGTGGDNMYAMGSILINTVDNSKPTVTADPIGGIFNTSKTVTLTATDDQDPHPKIYYTTNGDDPTISSTLYSVPIDINTTTILKFIAVDNEGNISNIQTETYTIDTTKPLVSANPKGGISNASKTVTLTASDDQDPHPKIYYTTNKEDPTINSTPYTGSFNIDTTTTLKFIAVDHAGNISNIQTETYTIDRVKPTANAKPIGGTYTTTKKVTLLINETGSIYYTLNGSTPTTSSQKYTTPINITKTTTLKFRAVDQAGNQSTVYTQKYTINDLKLAKTYPKNNTKGFSLTTPLKLVFNKNLSKGTGYKKIILKNMTTGKLVSITSSISGKTLTIKQKFSRLNKNTYQLYIPVNAFKTQNTSYSLKFKTK